MDLPPVPLLTEGAEAEVLLSGWLEKLAVGHGWIFPKSLGTSFENHGKFMGNWMKMEIK